MVINDADLSQLLFRSTFNLGNGDFSLHHRTQTGSGATPVSSRMNTGASLGLSSSSLATGCIFAVGDSLIILILFPTYYQLENGMRKRPFFKDL